MDNTILESLGLTSKEAEVYQILLKLGESPIGDLLKETGDHPQIVYRAIDGLVAQNLAHITYRRHRKYARAEDPHTLLKMGEKRLEQMRSAIPDLLALQKVSKDAVVTVAKGNEAVRLWRVKAIDMLARGETYLIIGGSGDRYYEIMGEMYKEVERKRINNNIHKKLIAFESQRKAMQKNDTMRDLAEFRFLPSQYPVPSSTNIAKDTVAIVIWHQVPIVITIESKEVAESYTHYFDSLWQIAKE